MKKFFLFSFLFSPFVVIAGNDNENFGARSGALANASVTLSDVWSCSQNQAGLGFVKNISAGVFYEDRFMLKQLGNRAFACALPVKGGCFGISYSNFGYTLYGESKYGLAYAKSFGERISAGIQLDYLTTRIGEGYGTHGAVAGEAGLQFKLIKNLTLGVHIYNINRAKLADYNNENIPTIMRLGMDYKFSEKVFVAVETEKDIDHKAVLKAGCEYHIVDALYLRAGISTNPSLSCFGFGIKLKNFKLDLTSTYHSVLGFSPQFGMSYTVR